MSTRSSNCRDSVGNITVVGGIQFPELQIDITQWVSKSVWVMAALHYAIDKVE